MEKKELKALLDKARIEHNKPRQAAYEAAYAAIIEREVREGSQLTSEDVLRTIKKVADELTVFGDHFKADAEKAEASGDKEKQDKRYGEAAEQYGRANLLTRLLPEKVDESLYPSIVLGAIKEVGAESRRDMGNVIKQIKGKYGMSLDYKKISSLVMRSLS